MGPRESHRLGCGLSTRCVCFSDVEQEEVKGKEHFVNFLIKVVTIEDKRNGQDTKQ